MTTKPMVIRLTDDERAELERRRAAGGHRSLNETVRAWLVSAPGQVEHTYSFSARPGETYELGDGKATRVVPVRRKVKGFDPKTGEPIYE